MFKIQVFKCCYKYGIFYCTYDQILNFVVNTALLIVNITFFFVNDLSMFKIQVFKSCYKYDILCCKYDIFSYKCTVKLNFKGGVSFTPKI